MITEDGKFVALARTDDTEYLILALKDGEDVLHLEEEVHKIVGVLDSVLIGLTESEHLCTQFPEVVMAEVAFDLDPELSAKGLIYSFLLGMTFNSYMNAEGKKLTLEFNKVDRTFLKTLAEDLKSNVDKLIEVDLEQLDERTERLEKAVIERFELVAKANGFEDEHISFSEE